MKKLIINFVIKVINFVKEVFSKDFWVQEFPGYYHSECFICNKLSCEGCDYHSYVKVSVSCGNFPVAGRTVKEVVEFLREVPNIDQLSTGLVNGSEAKADYTLKPGDTLEFLKPAGSF